MVDANIGLAEVLEDEEPTTVIRIFAETPYVY